MHVYSRREGSSLLLVSLAPRLRQDLVSQLVDRMHCITGHVCIATFCATFNGEQRNASLLFSPVCNACGRSSVQHKVDSVSAGLSRPEQ